MEQHTYTFPDALIVASLAALWGAYLYFKHRERQKRAEIIHQERLVAMEKGISARTNSCFPDGGPDHSQANSVPLGAVSRGNFCSFKGIGLN